MKLTIKNPLIEELMLWSHRRCDVVRVEVLCSHYPGAENSYTATRRMAELVLRQ